MGLTEKRKKWQHEWRKNNPEWQEQQRIYRQRAHRKQVKELTEIKNKARDRPCLDCGKRFPVVCMDFDHVNGPKINNVSETGKFGRVKFLEEIAKCEVVCSNCHRIRTHAGTRR